MEISGCRVPLRCADQHPQHCTRGDGASRQDSRPWPIPDATDARARPPLEAMTTTGRVALDVCAP
jgi:hypothetical protein